MSSLIPRVRADKGYPVNYRAVEMDLEAYPTWDPEIGASESRTDGNLKVYANCDWVTEILEW